MDYKPADKYVVVNNNDPDLRPIVLSLPKPPELKYIDGYGLPPTEQRFKRLEIPRRLIDLESEAISKAKAELTKMETLTILKIQKKFWDLIQERSKQLKKEISFIRKFWWHRIYGYWFFCYGKPTYITGRHFYYLNVFSMDSDTGYPEYRDCDRREYVFHEYCWTCTETFEKLDGDGWAIPEPDGSYKMVDLYRRVCLGSGQSKNRRRGNTSKAISDGIEITSRTTGTEGFGIQSYTEENARAHFKGKVLPAWDSIPLWLKPFSTSGKGGDSLRFDVSKNDFGYKGLGNAVAYATTSSPKAFDGKKFKVLLTDEEGKELISGSVAKRWEVNKHTLAQGDGMKIHGFSYHPSTADQQSAGAFDYYFLIQSSNFYRRYPIKGQTISGLFRIFIPAQDGLEGFVDSYGYSVTGEVKDYQKKEGFKTTAEEYLNSERELLLKDGSPEAMAKYREHKKLYPMQYSDSWIGTSGDIGFDIEKIDKRLTELKRSNNTIRGNLEWVDNEFLGSVKFVEDKENGRFVISKMPPENIANKKVRISFFNAFTQKTEEAWRPMYPGTFTAGADPFKTGGKGDRKISDSLGKKSRLSDGGLTILWNYDETLDGMKVKSLWESYRFVLTYRNRLNNTDDFNEDVAKACIFFGAMLYPETNVMNTYEYFVKNKLGGYLIYDTDKYTGKLRDKPGMDTLDGNKQDIFALWRDYIDYRCEKEEHEDLLRELKDITGIEFMRHFDLIASGGMSLMGAKSSYAGMINRVENQDYDYNDFIWT